MKHIAKNLEETQMIAKDFVRRYLSTPEENKAVIVGLYGELGSGKTSFVQGIAKEFGVSDIVVSPTFVIEKIYELKNINSTSVSNRFIFEHLIHIDAYRIERSEELLHLGWKEIISNPKNLILIEWPECVADIMPSHLIVKFTHTTDGGREIEI